MNPPARHSLIACVNIQSDRRMQCKEGNRNVTLHLVKQAEVDLNGRNKKLECRGQWVNCMSFTQIDSSFKFKLNQNEGTKIDVNIFHLFSSFCLIEFVHSNTCWNCCSTTENPRGDTGLSLQGWLRGNIYLQAKTMWHINSKIIVSPLYKLLNSVGSF